jgi:hypothetical protein
MLKQAMDPETANATFCAVGEKKNVQVEASV